MYTNERESDRCFASKNHHNTPVFLITFGVMLRDFSRPTSTTQFELAHTPNQSLIFPFSLTKNTRCGLNLTQAFIVPEGDICGSSGPPRCPIPFQKRPLYITSRRRDQTAWKMYRILFAIFWVINLVNSHFSNILTLVVSSHASPHNRWPFGLAQSCSRSNSINGQCTFVSSRD